MGLKEEMLAEFGQAMVQIDKDLSSLDDTLNDMERTVPEFRSTPRSFRRKMLKQMEQSTAELESVMAAFGGLISQAEAVRTRTQERLNRARRLIEQMGGR